VRGGGRGPVAYELVEIVDPTLAENISVAIRKNRPADGAWVGDTTLERMMAGVGSSPKNLPSRLKSVASKAATVAPSSRPTRFRRSGSRAVRITSAPSSRARRARFHPAERRSFRVGATFAF
jgi:hypothetical protein